MLKRGDRRPRATPCRSMSPRPTLPPGAAYPRGGKTGTMAQGKNSAPGRCPAGRHGRPPHAANDLHQRADHRSQTSRPQPDAHRKHGPQGTSRSSHQVRPKPSIAGWWFRIALRPAGLRSGRSQPGSQRAPLQDHLAGHPGYLPSTTSPALSPWIPRARIRGRFPPARRFPCWSLRPRPRSSPWPANWARSN